LTDPTQTRAPARGLTVAAAFGSVVGLAIGAAYLGGTVAKATVVRVQAERIAGVRDAGYTEEYWILNVEGTRLVIAAERSAGSPQKDLAELRAVLDSIRIEP